MSTGRRISRLRESRGVLQKDLSKAINVDPVVLNRIEKTNALLAEMKLKRLQIIST